MNHRAHPTTGYFLFSLDTELATGHYDCFQPKTFSPDGSRERWAINRLLDILDEFHITATWAVVGHLFYEHCEHCERCPFREWDGDSPAFEMVYDSAHPLWYGADVVDTLLARGSRHELAFHGYTHRVFDESQMTAEEARFEIQEWLRLASRKGIVPKTVIFPRNLVGHLDLFKEAGFICFRGEKVMHPIYYVPLLGKILNRIDLKLQFFAPQAYDPSLDATGMVNLHESQWLFRIDRRIENILDAGHFHNFRIRHMAKAVEHAGRYRRVIHIWAHPYEFRTNQDFEKLRFLFGHVANQVDSGRLRSVSMAELAETVLKQGDSEHEEPR